MKRAVITILGTAGAKFNKDVKKYIPVEMEERAKYKFLDGSKLLYHNTFPLLIEKYQENYKILALYTKEAKQSQEDILKLYGLKYNFDEKYFIENPNDDKTFFDIINSAIKSYDEVIFDVSHGFRHLPLLALIGLIVENIENPKKIRYILFAQEEIPFKKYNFIDLKNYLNIANIALVLRNFLSTYKVLDLDLDMPLYKSLRRFSINLTSNQYKNVLNKDLDYLKQEIIKAKKEFFFIEGLLEDVENILSEIEAIKYQQLYEQFLFFAKFFLNKKYLLQSSAYLIEGLTFYISTALEDIGYCTFDVKRYDNQQKIVSLLKFNLSKNDFNFPNEYFIDINSKAFNKFAMLRERIAGIRHNLSHINTTKSYGDLEKELKQYIQEFEELINNKTLYKLDKTLDNKKRTLKYILEVYYKKLETTKLNQNSTAPKLNTLLEKYDNNELESLTALDKVKLDSYIKNYIEDIKKLLDYQKKNKFLLSWDEASCFKLVQSTQSQQNSKLGKTEIETHIKTMPNNEQRKVKKLKSRLKPKPTGIDVSKKQVDELVDKFKDR
jgi:CRISPR-associated DxTHG motif protein